MVDRPILFSAAMVRALLDGRKTQTRRVLGGRGEVDIFKPGAWSDSYVLDPGNAEWRARYTPFEIGDRLWVKETWRAHRVHDGIKPSEIERGSRVLYEAEGRDNCDQHGKTRVSIFMPRWASRLTLTVTDVRVQRLQDCSEADAIAEGIEIGTHPDTGEPGGWKSYETIQSGRHKGKRHPHAVLPNKSPVTSYAELWDSINGAGAWETNPWVVAVSFDVRKENIDG